MWCRAPVILWVRPDLTRLREGPTQQTYLRGSDLQVRYGDRYRAAGPLIRLAGAGLFLHAKQTVLAIDRAKPHLGRFTIVLP